ncbi:mechanosensitive ion channel family protein [Flavihumibacter sp. UBA7668]|uniref:mechanosensitive ion channel family protein n=1 Tax=Flavihumibacter sp. UBA7668 TaxID=1946542 RepID=UPI0025B864FC|nr:mechanosensitive ion channel domain-containing protein [Flavihumibacter sp. UBA7668]
MRDVLDYIFLENTVRAYLICFGAILLAIFFKRYLSRVLSRIIFKIIKSRSWKIDQYSFVELVFQPMQVFLIISITMISLENLSFPQVLNARIYQVEIRTIVASVAKGIWVITFIWLMRRMIEFIAMLMEQKANLTEDMADNQMVVFFKDFFKAVLVILGILLVIRFSFNKDITTYLAGLSIVAGALALAARESLENLIASFIIFFDKPFHVGDTVKVQHITGTIERIGLRSTRLRTDQKTYVSVPNKQMVDSIMDNLSLRSQRRADLKLELSLKTSSVKLDHVVAGIKNILSHPAIENYTCFLSDITANSFQIHVEYYSGMIPITEFNQLKQTINLDVLRLLESMDVELAGETKEVLIAKSN